MLLNEDKELAELRGLAAGVGLANACYAIQYVAWAIIMEHLGKGWATAVRVPMNSALPRTVMVYTHFSGRIIENFLFHSQMWMANYAVIRKIHKNTLFSSVLSCSSKTNERKRKILH